MAERKIDPKFNIHESYRKVHITNAYRHGGTSGGGVDADYQAVLNAVSANGDPLPSAAQQAIDNQLMIDYKATGAWDKTDVFFKFNGSGDSAYKLYCWKRKIKATPIGGLTWSSNGVEGNKINAYIKTGYIVDGTGNYQLNNAGIIYKQTKALTEGRSPFGVYKDNNHSLVYAAATTYYAVNCASTASILPEIGLSAIYKDSSTSLRIKHQNTSDDKTVVERFTLPNAEMYILARNRADNGTTDTYSSEGFSYFIMGASMVNEHESIKSILV